MSVDGDGATIALLERVYQEVRGERRDLRESDRIDDDLGLDSLARAEIATALEDELGVSLIDDERLPLATTVGDLLAIVASAQTSSREETAFHA